MLLLLLPPLLLLLRKRMSMMMSMMMMMKMAVQQWHCVRLVHHNKNKNKNRQQLLFSYTRHFLLWRLSSGAPASIHARLRRARESKRTSVVVPPSLPARPSFLPSLYACAAALKLTAVVA
jgi:hypothetical protein